MAAKVQASDISVIEKMAAEQHKRSRHLIRQDQLSREDRQRLMDAMEAAVAVIPDELMLKHGTGIATVRTGEA